MPGKLTCNIQSVGTLAAIEKLWRGLDDSGKHSFFVSWPWVGTWVSNLPTVDGLRLVEMRNGSETIGLAFLGTDKSRLLGLPLGKCAHFNSSGNPVFDIVTIEHNGFATSLAEPDALWPAFWETLSDAFDEVVVPGVDAAQVYQPSPANAIMVEVSQPAYRIALSLVRNAGNLENLISRNARQQLRQSFRDCERMGPVSMDAAADLKTALAYFSAMKELHVASWQSRGRPHAFRVPFFETFHRDLIERAFASGAIDLLRFRAGARTLGYLYNFRRGNVVHAYQSGFDRTDPSLRPGYVCHALAADHYARARLGTYDFMGGFNRLKESFATETYAMYWNRYRRPTSLYRAEFAARRWVEKLRGKFQMPSERSKR
ncbi:MAG: GNAT family N-acetyltransferase [Rhizomicrobium sp.]